MSSRRRRVRVISSVSWTVFALLAVFTALLSAVVLMLARQGARTNERQAAIQLRSGAAVAASTIRADEAGLRARAARLAVSPALQRAVAAGDRRALRRLAHTLRARIETRASGVFDALPPPPRVTSSITLMSSNVVAARVRLALPLGGRSLARLRRETPLPPRAQLVLVAHGRVAAGAGLGTVARLRGDRALLRRSVYVAGSAPLARGLRIVALESRSDLSARAGAYLHRVVLAALLTLLIGALLAARLARPLARMVGELSHHAERDALTGLATRRLLDERLREELERAARNETHLALVLLDVDDFKRVNDRHGHQCGDRVLQGVAEALTGSLRELDLAGRFGGEEFALVLPGTSSAGAARVAEHIRRALAELDLVAPDGEPLRVSASFGVAAFPQARECSELVARADGCLYAAKRRGKDCVVADEPRSAELAELELSAR